MFLHNAMEQQNYGRLMGNPPPEAAFYRLTE
jgi:hypothetical protein